MYPTSLFVLLSALLSLLHPTMGVVVDIRKRSFAVERVRNPDFTGRNGPQTLARTYRKYNIAPPQGLLDAVEAQVKRNAMTAAQKKRKTVASRSVDRRGVLNEVSTESGPRDADEKGSGDGNGNRATNQNGHSKRRENRGQAVDRTANRGQKNEVQNREIQNGLQDGNTRGRHATPLTGNRDPARTGNRGRLILGSRKINKNNDDDDDDNVEKEKEKEEEADSAQGSQYSASGDMNTHTEKSNSHKQSGSVAAVPEENDAEFISPVTIGGQTLNLDFDTGSSDLWIFTTELDPATTAHHRVYDASKSPTFELIPDATFAISYGDGSGARGIVGTDVVSVGAASFSKQAIELATTVSHQFVVDQPSDGILGLGLSNINTVRPYQQKTFLDNIKNNLAEPVFTADLRKGHPGTYSFGAIDSSRFRGPLAWIPVNAASGFWQFGVEWFGFNKKSDDRWTALPRTPGGRAIADTGTSLILVDDRVVAAYYAQVPGARQDQETGGFIFPCHKKLPNLALDVGGVYLATVSGRDLNFAEVENGTCFGGLQAIPSGQPAVLGDIFFKSQFVVFNAGNNTLGMAPHAYGGYLMGGGRDVR